MSLSCSAQRKSASDKVDKEEEPTSSLHLVMRGDYSNSMEPTFQVIRGEKALKMLFSHINKTRKPGIPVPAVDFKENILLFYSSGRISGQKDLELCIKKEFRDSIWVGVENKIPLKKVNSGISTTPFCIYSIPQTAKKVVLFKNKEYLNKE
ncbi:hypothetical protein GCM10007383_01520 [Arenibacter certesii]|uniref:Uncharacterized protein n=2 Tax=Arenibacter certesii TaxID=228955 RepID=A0A918ILP8_9FLAO|nr:hypothetical protein GCM10007383_01520 [Arenibacter certesii]